MRFIEFYFKKLLLVSFHFFSHIFAISLYSFVFLMILLFFGSSCFLAFCSYFVNYTYSLIFWKIPKIVFLLSSLLSVWFLFLSISLSLSRSLSSLTFILDDLFQCQATLAGFIRMGTDIWLEVSPVSVGFFTVGRLRWLFSSETPEASSFMYVLLDYSRTLMIFRI